MISLILLIILIGGGLISLATVTTLKNVIILDSICVSFVLMVLLCYYLHWHVVFGILVSIGVIVTMFQIFKRFKIAFWIISLFFSYLAFEFGFSTSRDAQLDLIWSWFFGIGLGLLWFFLHWKNRERIEQSNYVQSEEYEYRDPFKKEPTVVNIFMDCREEKKENTPREEDIIDSSDYREK